MKTSRKRPEGKRKKSSPDRSAIRQTQNLIFLNTGWTCLFHIGLQGQGYLRPRGIIAHHFHSTDCHTLFVMGIHFCCDFAFLPRFQTARTGHHGSTPSGSGYSRYREFFGTFVHELKGIFQGLPLLHCPEVMDLLIEENRRLGMGRHGQPKDQKQHDFLHSELYQIPFEVDSP